MSKDRKAPRTVLNLVVMWLYTSCVMRVAVLEAASRRSISAASKSSIVWWPTSSSSIASSTLTSPEPSLSSWSYTSRISFALKSDDRFRFRSISLNSLKVTQPSLSRSAT